jgi:hypothetical protein
LGLKRLQLKAGIRGSEALVVTKYGETRWTSGCILIAKNNDLHAMPARLAVGVTEAGPDLVAFYREQRRSLQDLPEEPAAVPAATSLLAKTRTTTRRLTPRTTTFASPLWRSAS